MFNRKLNSARRSGGGQADGASIRTEWRSVELAWRARNEGSLRNGSRGDANDGDNCGSFGKMPNHESRMDITQVHHEQRGTARTSGRRGRATRDGGAQPTRRSVVLSSST